jgi:hypothetical protein
MDAEGNLNSNGECAWDSNSTRIWLGIAAGVAVGVGIALSRRKRSRWEQARDVTQRVADRSPDLAEAGRDIVEHIKTIYDEGLKLVEDAGQLWASGRELVGH